MPVELLGWPLFDDSLWGLDFSNLFGGFGKQLFNNASNFVSKNGGYELSMDVDVKSTADNVEINLEKDGLVDIKYHIKNANSEHMVSVKEYLPKNADPDTLDAEIKDGKLIVTVKRKIYDGIDTDGNLKKIEIKK